MHDGVILSWEQGLGKTLAALAWPIIKGAQRVLIVAPGGLHLQIRKCAQEMFGIHITGLPDKRHFHALRLHLPQASLRKDAFPRFYITTYQDLGYNDADEWPDTVTEDGLKSARADRIKRRLLDPGFVQVQRTIAKLNGGTFETTPFFEGIGEERTYEIDDPGMGLHKRTIRCVWRPTLARTIAQAEAIGGGFDCVVIDEGTKVQANDSHIANGVRQLNPKFRLVLTGTPIKNRLESAFWLCWWACGGSALPTARWPYEGTSEAREEFANQHLQHDRFLTREEEVEGRRGNVSKEVFDILVGSVVKGNTLTIPTQLPPNVYAKVKKWVESNGGRWDRKLQAHAFGGSVSGLLARLRPIDPERRSGKTKIEKRSARICNIHRLWKLLAPVIIRRRKDECGEDIVPKTIKPIHVLPGTAQQQAYAFHLANPPLAAKATPTKRVERRVQIGMQLTCLRQAALCPEADSLAETVVHPEVLNQTRRSWTDANPKQAAILTLIGDILDRGEQVIIGSPFRTFSQHLHRRLIQAGVSSVLLDGDTSPAKRGELVAQFKARRFSTMVAGLNAMSEGHDIACCSNLILPSYSWAYDENEQFIHRIWRLTSPKPVTIYALIMTGTIDERIWQLWSEKGDSAQLALDGRLTENCVEEVDLAKLLESAVRNFDPDAPTVDEQDIEAQWNAHLRERLRAAEGRFREAGTHGGATAPASGPAPKLLTPPSRSRLSTALARIRSNQQIAARAIA